MKRFRQFIVLNLILHPLVILVMGWSCQFMSPLMGTSSDVMSLFQWPNIWNFTAQAWQTILGVSSALSLWILFRHSRMDELRQRFEGLTEANPVPAMIFDPVKGRIHLANHATTTLLRVAKNKLIGRNIFAFFASEEDRQRIIEAIKNNVPLKDSEMMMLSHEGQSFWAMASVTGVRISGRIYGVLGFYDVSQRKAAESRLEANAADLERQILDRTKEIKDKADELEKNNAEIQEAKKQAENANFYKSQFLANMSHELRTPLDAILGYADVLREEAEEKKNDWFVTDLTKIQIAGKKLLNIINDILDLSKIESNKIEIYVENFSIEDLIHDLQNLIEDMMAQKDNQLIVDMEEKIGVMHSDVVKIRQGLFNVLSYACQATHRGTVTFKASRLMEDGKAFVRFMISDTGAGMTPEQVDKIFKPFQEAESSHDRKKQMGTGLGLAITKNFCQLLGGKISVRSAPDEGSAFTITLPADASEYANASKHVKG